jgi:hypothetical protein
VCALPESALPTLLGSTSRHYDSKPQCWHTRTNHRLKTDNNASSSHPDARSKEAHLNFHSAWGKGCRWPRCVLQLRQYKEGPRLLSSVCQISSVPLAKCKPWQNLLPLPPYSIAAAATSQLAATATSHHLAAYTIHTLLLLLKCCHFIQVSVAIAASF